MVLRIHHPVHSAGSYFTTSAISDSVYGKYLYPGGLSADMSVRDRMIQTAHLYYHSANRDFAVWKPLLRFYFSFITAWLGQTVVKDLRVAVYKRVLSLNLSQYDKTPIGTLTTRTINDIEAINDIFSEGLIPIVSDLLIDYFHSAFHVSVPTGSLR